MRTKEEIEKKWENLVDDLPLADFESGENEALSLVIHVLEFDEKETRQELRTLDYLQPNINHKSEQFIQGYMNALKWVLGFEKVKVEFSKKV